jgi:hypothetical protein
VLQHKKNGTAAKKNIFDHTQKRPLTRSPTTATALPALTLSSLTGLAVAVTLRRRLIAATAISTSTKSKTKTHRSPHVDQQQKTHCTHAPTAPRLRITAFGSDETNNHAVSKERAASIGSTT